MDIKNCEENYDWVDGFLMNAQNPRYVFYRDLSIQVQEVCNRIKCRFREFHRNYSLWSWDMNDSQGSETPRVCALETQICWASFITLSS